MMEPGVISFAINYLFLVKPLDSSLESENDRYENGAQDGSENGEGGNISDF